MVMQKHHQRSLRYVADPGCFHKESFTFFKMVNAFYGQFNLLWSQFGHRCQDSPAKYL
jgi:hypothetical protein